VTWAIACLPALGCGGKGGEAHPDAGDPVAERVEDPAVDAGDVVGDDVGEDPGDEDAGDDPGPWTQGTIVFNSGFEPETTMQVEGVEWPPPAPTLYRADDLWGRDLSVPPPNHWELDLDDSPYVATFWINYGSTPEQGGHAGQRLGELVTDPADPANTVMSMWALEPNNDGIKCRVQATASLKPGTADSLTNVHYSMRVYFPESSKLFEPDVLTSGWFIFQEIWNNPQYDSEFPFRVTISLRKHASGGPLRFQVKGERRAVDCTDWPEHCGVDGPLPGYDNENIWVMEDPFPIPVDTWMTLNVHVIEGDEMGGKVYMDVTPEGGDTTVLFGGVVTATTHHPLLPSPLPADEVGFAVLQPIKLYAASSVVLHAASLPGGRLEFLWDDFKLAVDAPIEQWD
jgi:hypothetical protein